MRTLVISTQKAVSILKKEGKMELLFSKQRSSQIIDGVLLGSGAKLYRIKPGHYALCGYYSDGSDVTCYVQ